MNRRKSFYRFMVGVLLIIIILTSLTGCVSNKVKDVTEQIAQIGTVSLASDDVIKTAEAAYSALSEKERSKVENYEQLIEARTTYDRIKNVYDLIEEIGTVTKESGEAIQKAEKAYKELAVEEKVSIINYVTLTTARTTFDAIPHEVKLNKDNISKYFEVNCSLSSTKTSSYGTTKRYTTNATISSSAKLITSVESIDSVVIKIKATYSLDKLSYGKSNHTVDLTIKPDAVTGKGSASYSTQGMLIELIGGPTLGNPKFALINWEIVEVSGTITVKK